MQSNRLFGSNDCIEFDVDYETAYEGGASLHIQGDFLYSTTTTSADASNTNCAFGLFQLYKTRIDIPKNLSEDHLCISLRFDAPPLESGGTSEVGLVLSLENGTRIYLLSAPSHEQRLPLAQLSGDFVVYGPCSPDSVDSSSSTWKRRVFHLSQECFEGQTIASLDLICYPTFDAASTTTSGISRYSIFIGEIQICTSSQDSINIPSVVNLRAEPSWTVHDLEPGDHGDSVTNVLLRWEWPKECGDKLRIECCDLYYEGTFVGRAYSNAYLVENLRISCTEQQSQSKPTCGTFVVQTVNSLGKRQAWADAARIGLSFP